MTKSTVVRYESLNVRDAAILKLVLCIEPIRNRQSRVDKKTTRLRVGSSGVFDCTRQ